MLQAGYEVSCCDLLPEQFQLAEISCEHADLNDRIPFDDESFDALTCLNGLQRVWARGRAFSEMARVTKPGGYLILTMFNNNNLMRRAMFLLTGSIIYDTVGPPQAFTPDAPEPAGCFRYPLTIADTLAGISSVGLELLSLKGVLWSKGSLLLAPLALIPLLLHPLAPKRYRDRCHLRQASSLDVLFKDCVVVVGQKPMPQLQR
jgi:SAM-dependent methyltransferase